MSQVCFYFQLHQPFRLTNFSVFDVGQKKDFFEGQHNLNQEIFQKVANKSYVPMLTLLYQLVSEIKTFRFALSVTGVFIEQAKLYSPKVIELLAKLASSEQVEFLAETYHHSLSSLYDQDEFSWQVKQHGQMMKQMFGRQPKVFRNTELIYSNHIADQVAKMGFDGMLTEGVDRYLGGRERTKVYQSFTDHKIPLLLKHAILSDDIAFRFSDKNWSMYPLYADQYLNWLNNFPDDQVVNLFMDFETFGEHQWETTGIFIFFEYLVRQFSSAGKFITPSDQLVDLDLKKLPIYDVPEPISWADVDRDLTAWLGNDLQQDTINILYQLATEVKKTKDEQLIELWRKLQTSDHFYYMCTKWSADGDVHAYFSPYDSPYDAYNRYCAVLADLKMRIEEKRTKP